MTIAKQHLPCICSKRLRITWFACPVLPAQGLVRQADLSISRSICHSDVYRREVDSDLSTRGLVRGSKDSYGRQLDGNWIDSRGFNSSKPY